MNKRSAPSPDTGTPGKRRGRPPGPADRTRPHRVVTFVTAGELERLSTLTEKGDRSLSAVVHDLLVLALAQIGPEPRSVEDK